MPGGSFVLRCPLTEWWLVGHLLFVTGYEVWMYTIHISPSLLFVSADWISKVYGPHPKLAVKTAAGCPQVEHLEAQVGWMDCWGLLAPALSRVAFWLY